MVSIDLWHWSIHLLKGSINITPYNIINCENATEDTTCNMLFSRWVLWKKFPYVLGIWNNHAASKLLFLFFTFKDPVSFSKESCVTDS